MTRRIVGIGPIAGYVPAGRLDARRLRERFAVADTFLATKTGFVALARCAEGETACDLAEKAVRELAKRHAEAVSSAQALVVVSQHAGTSGIPHISAVLQGRLGLSTGVAAFDLGLACSGWVYGIAVLAGFMEHAGIDDALLVTVDPYSKILRPDDRDTNLLFGDAASVTVLTTRAPIWQLGKTVFGTDGAKAEALAIDETGQLAMNGRAVFIFSATEVPRALERALEVNGLSWDRVDRILLHQGSRYIVETIAERCGTAGKTPFLASEYGNTVSSSVPLMLTNAVCDKDRCVLVAGFGVGLSWAATALVRRDA